MDRHVAHAAALQALGELEDAQIGKEPAALAVLYGSIIGYVLAFDPNACWDAILRYRAAQERWAPQPPPS